MGHYDNCREGNCAVCGQTAVGSSSYCKQHAVRDLGLIPGASLANVPKKEPKEGLVPLLEGMIKKLESMKGFTQSGCTERATAFDNGAIHAYKHCIDLL